MTAPTIPVVSIDFVNRLTPRVRGQGSYAAERVAQEVRERFSFGPAWPLGESPDIEFLGRSAGGPYGEQLALTVTINVRDSQTGEPRQFRFGKDLNPHQPTNGLLHELATMLEEMVVHEVRESLRIDGKLWHDPHARDRETHRFRI